MSVDQYVVRRAEARIGTTLKGKYRIDSVLGIGGMAVVYSATHRNTKSFAIKVLHPELSLNTSVQTKFLREGYTANSVGHSGTVVVLDDDIAEDGAAFIVMELLHGASVESIWEQCGHHISVRAAVSIIDQLLDVLVAAHAKNIVHRDIKPANLFLTRDGMLKVLDFGIARARDAAANGMGGSPVTGTGVLLGTPGFMAPEQALGKSAEIDAQTDLWAAGATLYTILSGQFVHRGQSVAELLVHAATEQPLPLRSVVHDVPGQIAKVVDRALAFDKRARWPNALLMREALNDAYRAELGIAIDRQSLEILMANSASPPVASSSNASKPRPAEPSGTGTGRPVAVKGKRRATSEARVRLAMGAGALLVIAIVATAAGTRFSQTPKSTSNAPRVSGAAPMVMSAHTAAAPADSATVSPDRLSPPPEPTVSSGAAPLRPSVAASASPSARPFPAIQAPGRAAAGASPAAISAPAGVPRTSASTAPAANCNPPFFYDSQGIRIFKKECL